MERFGGFGGGGDNGSWGFGGIEGERCVIGSTEDSADAKGLLQIRRLRSAGRAVISGMEVSIGLETGCAILRPRSPLGSVLPPYTLTNIGIRSRMSPESQVHLTGTKDYSGPELLHCIIQRQLDSAMVFYSAKFGPRCSLARKLSM